MNVIANDHHRPKQQTSPSEVGWDGRSDARNPYSGPWSTNEQRKIGQATYSVLLDRRAAQALVRPPLAQVEPFPERHGYRTRQISILDIMNVDEEYNPRADYSGTSGGYTGSPRFGSATVGTV